MSTKQDLVVLGGGAAGTAAALRAAAEGMSVVLVELGHARRNREAETSLAELLADRPLAGAPAERRLEGWRAAVRRAGEAAASADDRRERRLRGLGVVRVSGSGRIGHESGRVRLDGHVLDGEHVLVATGARPSLPPGCDSVPEAWTDRTSLLDLAEPPASALVVGDGLEAAGVAGWLAAAGAQVDLACGSAQLLPEADPDLSAAVVRSLSAAGARVLLDTRLSRVTRSGDGVSAAVANGGSIEASRCFSAGPRRPNREACGLDELGLDLPEVLPEQVYETEREDIRLAGSVTGRELTAEAASREGRAVVARLCGRSEHVPHAAVPKLVAGIAGCGWSGLSEPAARAAGHALLVGRAQLPGSGRLRPGFVKVLVDSSSNRVLGVHAAGARSREAVLLGAVAVEAGLSRLDVAAWAFPEDSAAAAFVEATGSAEPA